MDFTIPKKIAQSRTQFKSFLKDELGTHLSTWHRSGTLPADFFKILAQQGRLGITWDGNSLSRIPLLEYALWMEEMARVTPGAAIAFLAHVDLGAMGLLLFGSEALQKRYGESLASGDLAMALGNTERQAGSDVASVSLKAEKVTDGWLLNGTKSYVTNGNIAHMAVITGVTDPKARRSKRLSMFLVDLSAPGIRRKKLKKAVWIPSDLTRLTFKDVFVPNDHLLGQRQKGLQQVLTIFTHSRIPIAAHTLGTAEGAFDLAFDRARKREAFGRRIVDFQAKAFEIADFYAQIEAASLMLCKACWVADSKRDFRLESSLAKYLAVGVARKVTTWAADIFGAASVMADHPIHNYPMDAWASALGEGTQDVQKLVIFREIMKRYDRV
jgi:alkylation response protein AidB-like acyl-CoA dehydrogenase